MAEATRAKDLGDMIDEVAGQITGLQLQPFQRETITAILEGRDAFVAVPTGKLKKKEKKISCHT